MECGSACSTEPTRGSTLTDEESAMTPISRPRCLGLCTATVVLAVLVLHGCASAPPHDVATPDVISQLSVQADAWDKAILRKDRAAIEQNMSEDFRQIDGAGNVEAKPRSSTDSRLPICRSTRMWLRTSTFASTEKWRF